MLAIIAAVAMIAAFFVAAGTPAQASYNGTGSTTYAAFYPMTDTNHTGAGANVADDTYNNNELYEDTSGCGRTGEPTCSGSSYYNPDQLDSSGITMTGTAASFNGKARFVTQGALSPEMSPNTNDFSYGYDILIASGSGNEYNDTADAGYNLATWPYDSKANTMQIGLSGDTNLLKSEINVGSDATGANLFGVPTCGWSGTNSGGTLVAEGQQTLKAKVSVDTGTWDHVVCSWSGSTKTFTITVTINGGTPQSWTKVHDSLGNPLTMTNVTFPSTDYLTVGGKKASRLSIDPHDTCTCSMKNVFWQTGTTPPENVGATAPVQTYTDANADGHLDIGDTVTQTTTVTNTGKVNERVYYYPGTSGTYAASSNCPTPLTGPIVAPTATFNCTITHTVVQSDIDNGQVAGESAAGISAYPVNTDPFISAPVQSIPAVTTYVVPSALTINQSETITDVNSDFHIDLGDTYKWVYNVNNAIGAVSLNSLGIAGDAVDGSSFTCSPTTVGGTMATSGTVCTGPSHTINSTDVSNELISNAGGGIASGTKTVGGGTVTSGASGGASFPVYNPSATSAITDTETATVTDLNGDGVTSLGDKIVFGYTVTNTGTRTLVGVNVTDAGPATGITCGATTLLGGASTTCTSAPYYVTSANVTAGTVNGNSTAQGTDTQSNVITSSPSTTSTTISAVSLLNLTKTQATADTNADGVTGDAGDVITYTFVLTNNNTVTGDHGGAVVDTYSSGTPSPVTLPSFPAAGNLAKSPVSGYTQTTTETHTITSAEVTAGQVVSYGVSTAHVNTSGALVTSNAATTTTATHPSPAASLTITDTPTVTDSNTDGVVDPGDHITWSYGVMNGPAAVTGLVIHDSGPATGITCGSTSLAAGGGTTCTSASYLITTADQTAGTVNSSAYATATATSTVTSNTANASTAVHTSVTATKAILIIGENIPSSQITVGNMPNYVFLRDHTAESDGNYLALFHPSTPNYLAILQGTPGAGTGASAGVTGIDCPPYVGTTTNPKCAITTGTAGTATGDIFDDAIVNGKTAKEYSDGMQTGPKGGPSGGAVTTCRAYDGDFTARTPADLYAVRHTMWPYMLASGDQTRCLANDISLLAGVADPLATDISAGTLPNVGYVAPNLYDDGHGGAWGGTATTLDNYLGKLLTCSAVPATLTACPDDILLGSDYTTGALSVIFTMDEGAGSDQTIPMMVLNKNLPNPGTTFSVAAPTENDHYDLNHWLDRLGGGTGDNNGAAAPDLGSLFGL